MPVSGEDIAGVRNQLDQAIRSLSAPGVERTGWSTGGFHHLREAVRLLEGIRIAARQEPPAPVLAPAIRELEARAARVGQLFDSAAAFYRGWFQASPAPAEDYTAEGVWAMSHAAGPGCALSFEA